MSRARLGTALLFVGPVVFVIAAFVESFTAFGDLGVPSACGGNCEQRLVAAAEHRHVMIVLFLGLAVASAIAGYLLRASVPDEQP